VQATIEDVLATGMTMMNAKGAAAVLMDVRTGEIIAMASLPDFDPNNRPNPVLPKGAEPGDSPLFNRAVQGVYELGSAFKIFAASQAMELGLVRPDTLVDADAPMVWGKFKIKELENHNYGPLLSVSDVIAKSSNVGTARIALMIGGERQQTFLRALGLFDPSPVEMIEAPSAKPIVPKRWPDITTITVSYGHGIAASPLALATAYATIANGGIKVTPTLIKRDKPMEGVRVMSEETAMKSVQMLRRVVTEGTASLGNVPGYEVAGKTGTAEKPNPSGGYYDEKDVNTFASVFPASNPRYVLTVTLDEPSENTGPKPRRTAGWTAVPVAAEVIRRAAPLLGLKPQVEAIPMDGVTAVSNTN
jgi:cell division protein FtsI (penicillin-binding protein 3)